MVGAILYTLLPCQGSSFTGTHSLYCITDSGGMYDMYDMCDMYDMYDMCDMCDMYDMPGT